jgi:hypothetical protein
MIAIFALWLATVEPWLWHDPGTVEAIDFNGLAGGAARPAPPFRFTEEMTAGTSAKVLVEDAAGVTWQVKGGPEARVEAFVSRLVSASGYFAEPVAFVPEGRIEGMRSSLGRARGFIQPDGSFSYAGFERRDPAATFLAGHGWSWIESPFKDTRELRGLKILMMLVSNWDNKDIRNAGLGSNTGVLEKEIDGKQRHIYFVNDWGQSLGRWSRFFGRTNWDCAGFTEQGDAWVAVDRRARLRFRYAGHHTSDFSQDITAEDGAWLMQYLGRITDAQIRGGLAAAGANPSEQDCFARALRDRIEQLRRVTSSRASAVR